MSKISLPYNDWNLLLTSRFGEWEAPWAAVVVGGIAGVLLLLLLWLYLYEMRLVQPLTAVSLFVFRLLVVALLFFVVVWQPTLARSEVEEIRHKVLVAIDYSDSMDFPDPQRTPLEKLLLARPLQIRPDSNQPVEALLDQWITHYQSNGVEKAPIWVSEDVSLPTDQRQKILLERKNLHDQICSLVDKKTRGEIVQEILLSPQVAVLDKLKERHDLEIVGFHEEAWKIPQPLKADTPAKDNLDSEPDTPGEKSSEIHFTNLNAPLEWALNRSETEEGKILGVLLFTDGQNNFPKNPKKSPAGTANYLGVRKIPIYPVAIGAREAPLDIVVHTLKTTPANVIQGMETKIEVGFRAINVANQELSVELFQDGKSMGEKFQKVISHKGEKDHTVRFPWDPKKLGAQKLTVKVRPKKGQLDELSQENNDRSLLVRVNKNKARVLVVEGEARWEFHYLHSALVRDTVIEPDAVVFVQPRIQQVPENKLEAGGHPRLHFPKWDKSTSPEDPLLDYDCLILGDVLPEQLPIEQRKRLARYVVDCGGTLVMLAGKRAMPLEYFKDDSETRPLADLLPILPPRPLNQKKLFSVTLSSRGITSSYMELTPPPDRKGLKKEDATSAALWKGLPGHYWGVIGQAKPEAVSLAFVPDQQIEEMANVPFLDEPEERRNALIVQQEAGFGRVLFVGLDSTWRWRFRVGDWYHHQFWSQVIRWAVASKLPAAGDRFVRFGSKQPLYNKDEDVEIIVRLQPDAPDLWAKIPLQAKIYSHDEEDEDKPVAQVSLGREKKEPNVFRGTVEKSLSGGQYRIVLDIPGWEHELPSKKEPSLQKRDTFLVLPSENKETAQLVVDWDLLETLAHQSHGQILTPDQIPQILNQLNSQSTRHEHHEELRAWQDQPLTYWFLGVFLVLLTLEWVVRKLAGLP